MNRISSSLAQLAALAAMLGATNSASNAVTFTANTTIAAGDTTYDGQDITVSGCTLTANGPHAFHSLVLMNGAVLTHSAAPSGQANDRLILTIAGDLTVPAGCRISADRLGYASDGGAGVSHPGCYRSGGAGYGGEGGTGANGCSGAGLTYGSITAPTDFGSGSSYTGAGPPGVSGGGAIQLDVGGTLTLNGSISADGASDTGNYGCGGGSGGSVFITTGAMSGAGTISASGGNAYAQATQAGGGGGGRIAVYHAGGGVWTGTISALGGSGSQIGGAGTVYQKDSLEPRGTLSLANGGTPGGITRLKAAYFGSMAPPDTIVSGACVVYSDDPMNLQSLLLFGNSAWSANPLTTANINVIGNASIEAGSSIQVDSKGYASDAGPGVSHSGCYRSGGAGYGGEGGTGHNGCSAGGLTYGSVVNPVDFGSGSSSTGAGPPGVPGGGAIRLTIGGTLRVDGSVSAAGANDAGNYGCGGGSGGSIYISASAVASSGSISANGGNAYPQADLGGGGGGGRVAVYYNANTYSGSISAFGGSGSQIGGAGTIYTKSASAARGSLLIANNGTQGGSTRLWSVYWPASTLFNVVVDNGARLAAGDPLVVGGLQVTRSSKVNADAQLPLSLTILGDCTIDATSLVSGDGCGYPTGVGPGIGTNAGYCSGGAGHGGVGGVGYNGGAKGGPTYGNAEMPTELGSGSTGTGAGPPGVSGGGAIHLVVDGTLTISGIISANGSSDSQKWDCGGGSGGSVYIVCSRFAGAGMVRARGGDADGNTTQGGGGGGGRISVVSSSSNFSGTLDVAGGAGAQPGGAGTINQQLAGSNGIPGDVDGSGAVTISDVIMAIRIAAGLANSTSAGTHFALGDVFPAGNPDHKISLEDAQRIIRHAYGLDPVL